MPLRLISFPRLNLAVSLLALFLIITGARLWLVQNYSTPLPYADQWDGEASNPLKPWAEGTLAWRDFFAPHNEHRIVLTRALVLSLFIVNRQWDPQLEMAVNAALCGAFAALTAGGLIGVFGGRWRWLIVPALAIMGTLPFGWENTLGGFQSQNYFLIFFSLVAIGGLGLHQAGSVRWWTGWLGLTLACLSMGSGFLAAVAILGLFAARAVKERARPDARGFITIVVCIVVVAAGWLTRVEVPAHAVLRAASPGAFLSAFCRFSAWPLYWREAWVLPMLLPLVGLAVAYLLEPSSRWQTRPARECRRVELLLGVGVWVLLQTAALAYSRDGRGAPPACRYMDLLAIVPLTSGLAAAVLIADASSRLVRGTILALTLLWLGALTGGLVWETRNDFQNWLPDHLAEQLQGEANARGYVATRDFQRYLADPPAKAVPYPNAARLAAILDDPTIRAFLPADLRDPLRLRLASDEAFVPNGLPPALKPMPWRNCYGSSPGGSGSSDGVVIAQPGAFATLPYLQFQFAGDLGELGTSFALSDDTGGHRQNWRPSRIPREHWRVDYLHRPARGDLRLTATDTNPNKWFAFTEPTEIGACSYWAGWVLRRAGIVFGAGLALAFLALGSGVVCAQKIGTNPIFSFSPQP